MEGKPALLAFGPDLHRWEDPSKDLLYILLEDLIRAGPDGGMLVQRLDVQDEQCLFITRVEESFAVLRKDGDEAVAAATVRLKEAYAACTRWAFRIDAPTAENRRAVWGGFTETLDWHPVTDG